MASTSSVFASSDMIASLLSTGTCQCFVFGQFRYAPNNFGLNFFHRRHIAPGASVEFDWHAAVQSQADVFHHLSVAQLDHYHLSNTGGCFTKRLGREGPERDRPEQPDALTFGASCFDCRAQESGK